MDSSPGLSSDIGSTALTAFSSGAPPLHSAVLSVVSLGANVDLAAVPVDQTPGQAGVIDGSEDVVWKCLGCRVVNHTSCSTCANCHGARPLQHDGSPVVAMERLRLKKLANEADRQAIDEELKQIQRTLSIQEDAERILLTTIAVEQKYNDEAVLVSQLLSEVNLLNIAQSGDAQLLHELDRLGALGAISDINKAYPFKPPGWSAAARVSVPFIYMHLATLMTIGSST